MLGQYLRDDNVLTGRRQRGFSHERDLLMKLWKKGFAVMRAPASGARARRFAVPDLVAIKNGVVFAFEVKTMHEQRDLYVPGHQVSKLREFIRRSGGYAFIAVKVIGSGSGWRFVPLDQAEETPGGNYKVSVEKFSSGLTIKDIIALAEKHKSIDEFFFK